MAFGRIALSPSAGRSMEGISVLEVHIWTKTRVTKSGVIANDSKWSSIVAAGGESLGVYKGLRVSGVSSVRR